jgi:hypothetical protein
MTKEGYTKLTGMKPTDEEFEIINGLCTVLTELSRAFSKIVNKEDCKKFGLGDYTPITEGGACMMYGKGEDRNFVFMVGFIYMFLIALLPDRSDDSFKSFERENLVAQRMLERDYKLSLDDRKLLLEKAKAAAKNITNKD